MPDPPGAAASAGVLVDRDRRRGCSVLRADHSADKRQKTKYNRNPASRSPTDSHEALRLVQILKRNLTDRPITGKRTLSSDSTKIANQPPAADRNERPDRLYEPEGPGTLKKAIN